MEAPIQVYIVTANTVTIGNCVFSHSFDQSGFALTHNVSIIIILAIQVTLLTTVTPPQVA